MVFSLTFGQVCFGGADRAIDASAGVVVNFADFALLVSDYGQAASWDGGAITYGATVSFADFALAVSNYGKQAVTSALVAAGANAKVAASMGPDNPVEHRGMVAVHLRRR
jgi:hypothetical protein